MNKNHRVSLALFLIFAIPFPSIQAEKSVVKVGDDVVVTAGERVESAVAIGGDVEVMGFVEEDVVAIGGDVYLRPGAVVRQNAVSIGGEVEVAAGARLDGDRVEVNDFRLTHLIPFRSPWMHSVVPFGFRVVTFLGFLALGVLVAVLLPAPVQRISQQLKTDPLPSAGWGVLTLVLIIPVIVFLAISIVGIPLIPLAVAGLFILAILGAFGLANLLGERLFQALNKPNTAVVLNVVLGLFLLWVLKFIPFLGWFVNMIILILGLGSVMFVLIKRMRKTSPKVEPPPA